METELKKFQRRQYFRLEKTIPIIYTELSDEEFTALLETKKLSEDFLHAERYAEGTCLDISGGGMRFVGSKMIETGMKLFTYFSDCCRWKRNQIQTSGHSKNVIFIA